jgi:hypothetical protein
MVGEYAQAARTLKLRSPAKLFVPLAWLIAGPANPAGYFAFMAWGMDFDLSYWIISVAIPLAVGCAGALFYLRGGGFGGLTLALVTALTTAAACAVTGPAYTIGLWALMQFDIYLSTLPLWSFDTAVITSGTFVRFGLLLLAITILPAVILLRLIAFQREAPKKKAPATSSLAI